MESVNFFENKHNSFKGQNIIITGATGGIGRIVTDNLIKLGANVIIISRTEKKVKDTFSNRKIDYHIMNFDDPAKINKGFVEIMKKFEGRLNCVIMCHGIFNVGKLVETNFEEFDKSINVNVRSCFHLISISTPFLKLTQGNIVVLSSVEAQIPFNDSFLNSISKVRITSLIYSICIINH